MFFMDLYSSTYRMKYLRYSLKLGCFLLLFFASTFSGQSNEVLLRDLDKNLSEKKLFVKKKQNKIRSIEAQIHKNRLANDDDGLYENYLDLYQEYRSFKYDSAYHFVELSKQIANKLNSPEKLTKAKIRESFILVSAGLFKESLDTLSSIHIEPFQPAIKFDYYITYARAYYDLADYNKDERFSIKYLQKGNELLNQAIQYAEPNSNEYWYSRTLKLLKYNERDQAQQEFLKWIAHGNLDSYYGIATSSLGFIYLDNGDSEKAIHYLTLAAISDVKNATMETVALRNLANELYKKGKYEKANEFIGIAMDDATFYNARHRKFEISTILPIIEKTQLEKLSQKSWLLTIATVILGLLLLVSIVFLYIIFKQLKERNKSRKVLNASLSNFKEINKNLSEANTIKEEYIAYFINAIADTINKIEGIHKSTIQKITNNKQNEAIISLKKYNTKLEREHMFKQFDEIFLKLFPTFIDEFNQLFPEKHQTFLKKGDLLNTELRIFALYRLGIRDSNQVANFLDLSVATIYTYKTRTKSKSDYKIEFERKIMAIKSN